MGTMTEAVVLLSVALSVAGTVLICARIQHYNRIQARRERFGLRPLGEPQAPADV